MISNGFARGWRCGNVIIKIAAPLYNGEIRCAYMFHWPNSWITTMSSSSGHKSALERVARQAMIDKGLEPDFAPAAMQQLAAMHEAPVDANAGLRDLRDRLWCSIDNDDSRDLDQLSVSEDAGQGGIRIFVS